jgi:ComEC/Rec2-related protein
MFLAGIALAMMRPVDPRHLGLLNVATGVSFAAALGYLALRRSASRTTGAGFAGWDAVILLVPALILGYSRFLSSNTAPDMRIGSIRVAQGQAELRVDRPLADTHRIRLRKTGPLDQDLRIRLSGELDARVAVEDARGSAQMDAQNRWRFKRARLPQESDEVIIRRDDPVGTEYLVAQPFDRIVTAQWLGGARNGSLALVRVSNHMGSFVRPGRGSPPVRILGRISADPVVYDHKTVLPVTPEFIQFPAGGPYYRVEGGDIQISLKPELENYRTFSQTAAYGFDVQVEGELSMAGGATNPGGFDARRFLQNYNFHGLLSVFQAPGEPSPIRGVAPAGGDLRRGNEIVEFSLDLRDRMLRILKATTPYPHSAFLGGVTLGLRYGLQPAVCMFHSSHRFGREPGDPAAPAGGCEELIAEEFKESGVNHVLAVSGLHVTIVTVMFVGIFSLLRMPRKVYTPLIFLALVVFAIITGARPSVLRAVIMNSLLLLSWAYLDQGLRSSALLGAPVAAFLILLKNPLVLVDPSFTLSFGAILSLALFTGPCHEILCKLRGNNFLTLVLFVVATTWIGIRHWALLASPPFLGPYLVVWGLLAWGGHVLAKRGVRVLGSFGYADLPSGVGVFVAAQFAIQIGMMIPLSSWYFCRWPFAGAFANLIAIPLIGVVVQLGVIAGLLGTVPGIGPFVALVLGAANWLFSSAFLWIAHASSAVFPYPFVIRPTPGFLLSYYAICALFVGWRQILAWLGKVCRSARIDRRWAPGAAFGALALCCLIPAGVWPRSQPPPGLNVTVLSAGYGSSILVETPGGRNLLIDTGFVQRDRGRRNEAIRTIIPYLCHRGIRRLDGLILTSPVPERAGGAAYLLEHLRVGSLVLPPGLKGLKPKGTLEDFERALSTLDSSRDYDIVQRRTMFGEWVGDPDWPHRPSVARVLQTRGASLANRVAGWEVQEIEWSAGQVLFEEPGTLAFRVEVLNPEPFDPAEFPMENRSAVLRIVYGEFAMLVPSDLHFEGMGRLAQTASAEQLRSQILVMPHRGTAGPDPGVRGDWKSSLRTCFDRSLRPFLDKVNPECVIYEFGNPRPVLGERGREAVRIRELTGQYLQEVREDTRQLDTAGDLALMIHSDGKGYTLDTQAGRNRAAGSGEEPVDDLAVGY